MLVIFVKNRGNGTPQLCLLNAYGIKLKDIYITKVKAQLKNK